MCAIDERSVPPTQVFALYQIYCTCTFSMKKLVNTSELEDECAKCFSANSPWSARTAEGPFLYIDHRHAPIFPRRWPCKYLLMR